MPTIELLFNKQCIKNYSIGTGDTLLIGRNTVNDIVIDNLAVSGQHAKIESIGKGFLYVDLQSENGSFVNDQHIKSHWLNNGDTITVGKHTLKFLHPENKMQEKIKAFGNTNTMQIDTRKFRELMKKNQKKESLDENLAITGGNRNQSEQVAILSYLTGNRPNIKLNSKMTKIGKEPSSDILVKGFGIGKISAVINRLPDGWYINVVGGLSKPQVNNKVLKKSARLENLDVIKIGSTKLQFLIFG